MNITKKHICDFLSNHSKHVTHVAVLHTPFYMYNASEYRIERMEEEARKQFWYFRRCFSQFLYGAKAHRKPRIYQPLMLTTIEGTRERNQKGLTIHYNIALGNIPSELTTDELREIVRHCWVDKAGMSKKKLYVEQAYTNRQAGWIHYTNKEAEQGNIETWDFSNTQIPYLALKAD